mmetsp:Transcript_13026/g.20475  ORF Transcript_13026/g.20475 Transcript_13026/m.20475 type:complete len:248 (-) Transcript_13026:78-821(-)
MLLHLSAFHQIASSKIHAVNVGSVVCQHGCQWPSYNFAPIDNSDRLAIHTIAHGKLVIVHLEVFQDLDDGKRSAGKKRLLGSLSSGWSDNATLVLLRSHIGVADVVVKVGSVGVAKSLDILFNRDGVTQVIVHVATVEAWGVPKARVVDHDSMHDRISIGLLELVLEIHLVDLPKLKLDSIRLASLASPLSVLLCGNISVREKTNQKGCDSARLELFYGFLDLGAENSGDLISLDFLSGSKVSHFSR